MADVIAEAPRRWPARVDPARRHRSAAIAARSTGPTHNPTLRIRQRRQRSPISSPRATGAPSALQNKRGSTSSNALASHTPPWTASRSHRTRPPRLTPEPTNRWPTASAPGPRHAPHVVELCTSHHVLTQRLRPTHLHAHRVVVFMQREHVYTQSRSGGQRQGIPVGPHAESHAPRVMRWLAESTYSKRAVFQAVTDIVLPKGDGHDDSCQGHNCRLCDRGRCARSGR
jgi:hypothetical protein